MLSGTYLVRPDWVKGLEWLEFLLVGGLLVAVALRLGPLPGLVAGAGALSLSAGVSWWMFLTHGIMLDASFPLVGLTLTYLALVVVRFFTTDRARKNRSVGPSATTSRHRCSARSREMASSSSWAAKRGR